MSENHFHKLRVLSLGFAVGIVWALGIVLAGLAALCFGWGTQFVAAMGSIYIGYAPTLVGVLIGLVWSFVDGFIGGVLIALIYNLCSCCCHKKPQQ